MGSPVVHNFTPDPTSGPIAPGAAIGFDVTDVGSTFRDILVLVAFPGTNLYEVIWDGSAFAPLYNAQSSISAITNGFHFSVLRAGGWAASPSLAVHAIDTTGAEAS